MRKTPLDQALGRLKLRFQAEGDLVLARRQAGDLTPGGFQAALTAAAVRLARDQALAHIAAQGQVIEGLLDRIAALEALSAEPSR